MKGSVALRQGQPLNHLSRAEFEGLGPRDPKP